MSTKSHLSLYIERIITKPGNKASLPFKCFRAKASNPYVAAKAQIVIKDFNVCEYFAQSAPQ